MAKPVISLILISYIRPGYLKEAIESIQSQTFPDWELLIMDYSPADNKDITAILTEAEKDKRVRIFRYPVNVDNLAICWNRGLDLIRGRYWGTIDDDNRKMPLFFEKMVGYLESHPEKDAVVCGERFIGEQQGVHHPKEGFTAGEERSGNRIDSGEIIYRSSLIERLGCFDERLSCLDDWDYIIRTFELSKGFGFLDEILTEYRLHRTNRIRRSADLGISRLTDIVQKKVFNPMLKIKHIHTGDKGTTSSQKQVIEGVSAGLKEIPFVEINNEKPDLLLIQGPLYNFTEDELNTIRNQYPNIPAMALCVEEPQALEQTLKRIRFFDWVVTNDTNAFDYYLQYLPPEKRPYVLHWNCLSISPSVYNYCLNNKFEKEYDVCFIGYPYPSRIEFIKGLRALLPDIKLALVGDIWTEQGINNAVCFETMGEIKTAEIGMKSKIVLLRHRNEMDLGGFPVVPPGSVNRGYIECLYGSVVMIDSRRSYHTFNDRSVLWYNTVERCAEMIAYKLKYYDKFSQEHIEAAGEQAKEQFTFKTRLTKILNCFRSPRFNIKIT